MHASNLLKKVLKPRNLPSGTAQSTSKKDNGVSSRRTTAETASTAAKKATAKAACSCSPTTHAGSFRCRLHRISQGRSQGLTPAAIPKVDGPKKPFKGSTSYIVSPVDLHSTLPRPTLPRPPPEFATKNKHRHKPSRLSRMVKAKEAEDLRMVKAKEAEETANLDNKRVAVLLDERSIIPPRFENSVTTGNVESLDHPEALPEACAIDSELYDLELTKGGKGLFKLSDKYAIEQDDRNLPEEYTRYYEAQKLASTADISSDQLDVLYAEHLKFSTQEPQNISLRLEQQEDDEDEDDHTVKEQGYPAADTVEESKLYIEPLRILDFKQQVLPNTTSTAFLVQWENLSVKDATWESSAFIDSYPSLLKDFLQRRSEQGDSIEFFQSMENKKALKSYSSSEESPKNAPDIVENDQESKDVPVDDENLSEDEGSIEDNGDDWVTSDEE